MQHHLLSFVLNCCFNWFVIRSRGLSRGSQSSDSPCTSDANVALMLRAFLMQGLHATVLTGCCFLHQGAR